MSESILERIAAGDQGAVRECMDQYGGLVWSIAQRWSRTRADAEDATQEIFTDIWKSAARFDPSRGSEKLFVTLIARRRLIDRVRMMERRPKTDSLTDTMPTLADVSSNMGELSAEAAVAARAVAQLDRDQQMVLEMGVVRGLTHSEIAEATGKPLGTVKTQLRRGLLKVRDMLESGSIPEDPEQ